MFFRIALTRLVMVGLCCFYASIAAAQQFDMDSREWSSIKNGNSIKSCYSPGPPSGGCDTLLCQVDFFNQTPMPLGSNYSMKEIRSFVRFAVDHANANIYAPFTYQLSYEIKGYKTPDYSVLPDVFVDTLMINYDPDSVNAYQDIHMRSYYGYYRIQVKVLAMYDLTAVYAALRAGSSSIPLPATLVQTSPLVSAPSGMATNWTIEAGMVQQKFDLVLSSGTPSTVYSSTMATIALNPTHSLLTGTNTLHINWDLSSLEQPKPALYELEWTYSDDYTVSLSGGSMTVSPKSNVHYDFSNNSTRIITDKTSYDIPLIYKRGYLAYRVRLLRPDNTNYLATKYGPWSKAANSGTISGSNGFYNITAAHFTDQANWNYEASFAEEGKSKAVLGYFDGLLKNRQTVTRFSSRPNELIGMEKFYDYEGRVGLQTLPIPVLQSPTFGLISNFALSAANQLPYKAADFDAYVARNNAAAALPGLHATAAAKSYYSPQNGLLGTAGYSMMKAVPDAEGFPLMQTQYMPDDPGRIKVQGGGGKELQIGKGHETSYFYSDPDQEELNTYFGNNIGKSGFYEKIITRDPNKELSFSVLNNDGKPVMTGVMGFPDPNNSTTLLNLDNVTASTGPYPFVNFFYSNPPHWAGNKRVFNKTFFKETSGGSLNYSLKLERFLPCTQGNIGINIPLEYNISMQGEHDAAPISIVGTTTAGPSPGSTTGPTVSGTVGTLYSSQAAVSLAAVGAGETTISYTLSYNPDHVDSAIKQYLREPGLYPKTACYNAEQDYLRTELSTLPDYCDDEGQDADYGVSECGHYESVMRMQLMPMGTYGKYILTGQNNNIVVGNGQSIFAIVAWKSKTPPYAVTATATPTTSSANHFAPLTVPSGTWPTNISAKMDAITALYEPVYAYQVYLPTAWSVQTSFNRAAVTVTRSTSPNELIKVYNDDIAAAMLQIHPEYCEYKKRYCDAGDFAQQLQAIPNLQMGQQLQLQTLTQLVSADPFSTIYAAQNGGSTDGLKNMSYKLVDGTSGAITGSRDVQLDYFAYLKASCDAGTDPATCWGAALPNASGGTITPPTSTSISALVNGLSLANQELYYQQLLKLYLANRGRAIAQYRLTSYNCGTILAWTDAGQRIFRDELDANGDPQNTTGTPSYSNIAAGNLQNHINSNTSNLTNPSNPANDIEAYAQSIVKQLLNCREVSSQNYNGTLFSNLLADLKAKMQSNILFDRDRVWKAGISPDVIRELLIARNVNVDDLCNPYLINYTLSAKSMAEPCTPDTGINYCDLLTKLDLNNSFLSKSLLDFHDLIVQNPITSTLSGTQSVSPTYNNRFESALAASLGYQAPFPSSLSYSWSLDLNDDYTIVFTNGSHQVTIKVPFRLAWNGFNQTSSGDLDLVLSPYLYSTLNRAYKKYLLNWDGQQGAFAFYGCYDDLSNPDTLKVFAAYLIGKSISRGSLPPYDGTTTDVNFKITGLDLSLFDPSPNDTLSRSCIHTCIACNELKDAYKIYQREVVTQYGIKGKGHPFYETSLRSFLNYYFRNRHYSDEYLNFMKGCNISDSLLLPQYYGYFQASGTSSQIDYVLNYIRTYNAVSPATPPLAGPNTTLSANLEGVKFLRYTDSFSVDHLFIDFTTVFSNERLRPFIDGLRSMFTNNASNPFFNTITWSINKLNSEVSGQPAYSGDIFLPGTNTPFTTSLTSQGVTLTHENVTIKDAAPGSTAPQLSLPFTHYHLEAPSSATSTDIAIAWGQLAGEVSTALNTAPVKSSYAELISHESFRPTHSNTVGDKVSYLNYVYNISPATSHDAILQQLLAPTLQTAVYTSGGVVSRDVSYRHSTDENAAEPSGTLQLMVHSTNPTYTAGFSFLSDILDRSKTSSVTPYTSPTSVAASGNIFFYATALHPVIMSLQTGITYNTVSYKLNSLRRVANNTYAYLVKPTIPGTRNYNVYLRLPSYISRTEALKYNLTSFSPLVYGSSKRYFKATFEIPGNATQKFVAIGKTDFDIVSTVPGVYQHVMLCDKSDEEDAADSITICYDAFIQQALTNAANANSQYQDSLYNSLRFQFRKYIEDYLYDNLGISQPSMKYAMTLYSYDRAGNLMSTTPPRGVVTMSNTAGVDEYRAGNVNTFPTPPSHNKQTVYRYGSLNQKLTESTPDAGLTKFVYDQAGRLVFSQNSKQMPAGKYSYTLYDAQNRPVETGQVVIPAASSLATYYNYLYAQQYNAVTPGSTQLKNLLAGMPREEVIRTTYDAELYTFATTGTLNNGLSRQENLRSRVAAVASYPLLAANSTGYLGYDIALHYSYDLSGNLKTLTYDMPGLDAYKQRYKRIDYDYDLYSGKVRLVSYNRGFADQYYQRYSYDDDNRITKTETSKDGVLWDRDAEYKYYPHGPLARISLGDQRVQGIDFAYTLQGWLKTINGDNPDAAGDMGGDGIGNNAHQADLYRTTLSYFDGDYKPLDATNALGTGTLLKLPPPAATNRSLYNGNIAASTNLPGYFPALYTGYRYDKLNRIKEANYQLPDYASSTPLGGTGNPYSITGGLSNLYHSDYTYDLDGNIETLNRYGFKLGSGGTVTGGLVYQMDQLDYKYFAGTTVNNKLTNFTDVANHSTTTGFTNDIAPYNPTNVASLVRLQYDQTGNLIQDLSNGLTTIDWTLYGKTRRIVKDDGHTLHFRYDPLGNRLSKTITTFTPTDSSSVGEYYIREASGNVLATYRHQQHYHYGNPFVAVVNAGTAAIGFPIAISSVLGTNSTFSGSLIGGAASQLSSFSTARIVSQPVSFYTARMSAARSALMSHTANSMYRLMSFDSSIAWRIYGAEAYNGEAFAPLAIGITDTPALQQFAAVLLSDTALRARYIALQGIDSPEQYSASQMGNMLASNILDWRQNNQSAQQLRQIIWDDEDSLRGLYIHALCRMLKDSAYLKTGPGAMILDTANTATALTLELQLRANIAGIDQSNDAAGVSEIVANFLGQYYSNTNGNTETGISLLRTGVGDESLLGAVYADSPAAFIDNMLTYSGAKLILANAMNTAATGGGSSTPRILSGLSAYSSSLAQAMAPVAMLDYDRLYLAEHTLYGSSRLGIKQYWPTQYRYEWRSDRTLAQNQAVMDSSEISYRRPWYYGGWQSLVAANKVDAIGNANTQTLYSSRVTGQKQYEVSNHLGNVMAVISDKVTEKKAVSTASIPSAVAKHAGLYAAYDYYPFGMIMPERSVEDHSIQCIPVSRIRMVNQVNYIDDWINPAVYEAEGPKVMFSGQGTTTSGYDAVDMGGESKYREILHNPYSLMLEAYMDFPPIEAGQIGALIEGDIAEHIFGDAPEGATTVTLKRVVDNEEVETLNSVNLIGNDSYSLPVEGLNEGDVVRIILSYATAGPNPLPPPAPPQANQSKIYLPRLSYSVTTLVAQNYVAMSCDTDGAFRENYRYGFNGQQKTDEIAGKGNFNTALFWEYDTRLGRRWNVDPIAQISISDYSVNGLNPILFKDPLGDRKRMFDHAQKEGSIPNGYTTASENRVVGDYTIETVHEKLVKGRVSGAVVGYFATKTKGGRTDYVLDNAADLKDFTENVDYYSGMADAYNNSSGGIKMMGVGLAMRNPGIVLDGIKQENKEAWSNPFFVLQMILSAAHAGTSIAEGPTLTSYSGTTPGKGTGNPNSIYTYRSATNGKAVSNYIYNNEGKCIFQVDFNRQGNSALSGHGHQMMSPGQLGSGHGGQHIQHRRVPIRYQRVPSGVTPSTYIGQ